MGVFSGLQHIRLGKEISGLSPLGSDLKQGLKTGLRAARHWPFDSQSALQLFLPKHAMLNALSASMGSATDSDLATCSGHDAARNGAVSNVCRPCQHEVEYLCYFMHRLLDFRHPEMRSLVSLLDRRDDPTSGNVAFEPPRGGSYLSPFWYVRIPSETVARSVAKRSLLVKVTPMSTPLLCTGTPELLD